MVDKEWLNLQSTKHWKWIINLRLGKFRSGLAFLDDEKNIGHLSMDVSDGDREELLMPLSNESELSITTGKPSALGLFITVLFESLLFLLINNFTEDRRKRLFNSAVCFFLSSLAKNQIINFY